MGRRLPAGVLRIDRFTVGELTRVGWRHFEQFTVQTIMRADLNRSDGIEAIEVGDGNIVDAVEHPRVPRRDSVKPAAAPSAPGCRAELPAHAVKHIADLLVLRGEGAFADASRVSL